MFRVFRTEPYERELNFLDNSEKIRVEKFEQALKINPFSGKSLSYEFLREKKFDGKRLLFLVYDNYHSVFLLRIVDKKNQKEVINLIKINFEFYKKEMENRIKSL